MTCWRGAGIKLIWMMAVTATGYAAARKRKRRDRQLESRNQVGVFPEGVGYIRPEDSMLDLNVDGHAGGRWRMSMAYSVDGRDVGGDNGRSVEITEGSAR
jgi:hypothetical protein